MLTHLLFTALRHRYLHRGVSRLVGPVTVLLNRTPREVFLKTRTQSQRKQRYTFQLGSLSQEKAARKLLRQLQDAGYSG